MRTLAADTTAGKEMMPRTFMLARGEKRFLAPFLLPPVEGIEPTNSAAELVLRRRKRSFGSQSKGGLRIVERMLTAVGTLRVQCWAVLVYRAKALDAHRAGLPAPKLLPTGKSSERLLLGLPFRHAEEFSTKVRSLVRDRNGQDLSVRAVDHR